ncbi:MAG: Iron-chelate-transporting ATPase [Bacteroidetes bacterium]|nr:Iron-chelate-transporting ATPase [Bacteroidota bacterium]
MLQAQNLTIGYDKNIPLIADISFDCRPSELIVLLGVNGIGKSTLLKTLAGLISPLSGQVSIDGKDIFSLPATERAQLISAVFTGRDFDPFITVREFVTLGRYPYTNWAAKLSPEDASIVDRAIAIAGLGKLSDKKVNQISDGERQKTLIAKSIAQDTPIIIMDEPTAFLDYKNKAELLRTIRELCVGHQKIILLSTHDISSALPYCDRAFLVTESGRFREASGNGLVEEEMKQFMEAN